MPTLNINGKRVKVGDEFLKLSPDQQNATVEEIARSMGAQSQPEAPQTPMMEDIGRSALSGLRSGVEGIVGAVGSTNKMTGDLASWLATKLGAGEDTADIIGNVARRVSLTPLAPTTEDIGDATDELVGERYQPQTTAGKYARTIGEFAPNAVAGPGGAIRKTAMAVVPAVLSEGAGQLTEGTDLEPWARVTGAVAGGALAAGKSPNVVKQAAKGAPTLDDLKAQTDALYGRLRDAGIKYDANAFANTIQSATDDLIKQGFRPSVAREAFGYLDDLAMGIGKSPEFDDINAAIQRLGEESRALMRTPDGKGRATALNIVRDKLMRMEEVAPIVSKVPLSGAQFKQLREGARKTAFRRIKARTLEELAENAKYYRSGEDLGVRNQILNLLRSRRGKQMFNAEEKAALMKVAQGRRGLETLSKLGIGLSAQSGGGSLVPLMGGVFTAGASLIPGTAAKAAAPIITERALQRASAAIRSGKLRDPTIMNAAKAEKLRANVRRLLAAQSGKESAERSQR